MPIAQVNNMDIWYDTFGNKENECLLLIMGGCCQGIIWPSEFCEQLAAAGFYVIRYDHRDTGLSSYFNYDEHPYDLNDLAQDAIGLLDYLDMERFHLMGLSMGGPIAEIIAVQYPERTLSVCLIATSSDFRPMNLAYAGLPKEEDALLSPPLDIYLNWMQQFTTLPSDADELQALELRIDGWQILNGFKAPFDKKRYRELQEQFIARARHPTSHLNHLRACQVSEEIVRTIPSRVTVPTMILHGTEDTIYPPEHGKVLAERIPHAQYHLVEGMGHIFSHAFYKLIVDNVKLFKKYNP